MSLELFNLNNDDYVWLHILNEEKNVHTLTRPRLNSWAETYDLVPTNYKNKKQIVRAIKELWESYFAENLEFKREYEIKYRGENNI
jgi:hypothetical protein